MPARVQQPAPPSLFEPQAIRTIPVRSVTSPQYTVETPAIEQGCAVSPAADTTEPDRNGRPVENRSHTIDEQVMLKPTARSAPEPRPSQVVTKAATQSLLAASRPPGARARAGATAEVMATRQREISVSEFFAKNRHLLGFDNKRKALLTTVKEAVDNSLDACEEAGLLPELYVLIDQISEERFKVTVRDNGPGIVKAQIPNVFGKLLYGSKFHRLKMSRGQQGIGISAAGMYGLLTTGKPIHITSRTAAKKPAHHFQIAIDTTKNRPDIVADEEQEVDWPHGTAVTIELVASYQKGRQSVDEYIEQTAIANPHAQIFYRTPLGESREFPRASQELPSETREIQPHPHGIELGVLMKMVKEQASKPRRAGDGATKGEIQAARTISGFLQNEFSRVTRRVAEEICKTAKVRPEARPSSIDSAAIERVYQAMQSAKVKAPPTDCLAPIGVRNLLAGLLKEVKAEFYSATTREPSVYRGNPFQIEIALAFGGALPGEEPARVIRFANRVPLLYQQSGCAAFKSVLDVDWRNYGVSQPGNGTPVGPLVIMVHMASVWVPFTSESKEAIADYDEIRKEMKLAIQECGRKLATYLRKRKRQRLEADRRGIFERYIPDLADALGSLTGVDSARLAQQLQKIARLRTAEADVELDEDGRPIANAEDVPAEVAKAIEAEAAEGRASGSVRAHAPNTEWSDDESVVIIPENEARTSENTDLFAAREPSPKKAKRGKAAS